MQRQKSLRTLKEQGDNEGAKCRNIERSGKKYKNTNNAKRYQTE